MTRLSLLTAVYAFVNEMKESLTFKRLFSKLRRNTEK